MVGNFFKTFQNHSYTHDDKRYQFIFKVRSNEGMIELKNPKTITDYSQTIDVYENSENFNPIKKRKVLIVFDDMIADMEANKKLSPIVTDLFLRGIQFNIPLIFISQSYFKVPKTIRLNVTHYFIMLYQTKRELQQIASHQSSDNEFKDF